MNNMNISNYYTSLESLKSKYKEHSRKLGFNAQNIEEFKLWQIKLREKLSEITGINKMIGCDLEPKLIESHEEEGYRRDKMVIQTETGVFMPFYILVPNDLKQGEKREAIIAAHGHLGGGKDSIAGRMDIPGIKGAIERFNYDYGVQLVHEGYVVFCPDARGFGERREFWTQGNDEQKSLNGSCAHLNNIAISLGYSLMGFMTWDLMRLIDFIQTLQFCDSERIGCCGFSGGGLQTLWLAAMDDRVKCAVISGYFYGSENSLLELPNCSCNFIPRLWEYVDIGDIGALIAPKPLLIESGSSDHLNGKRGIENVKGQLKITSGAYGLFNSEENLLHYIGEGGHYWYAENTFVFLKEKL